MTELQHTDAMALARTAAKIAQEAKRAFPSSPCPIAQHVQRGSHMLQAGRLSWSRTHAVTRLELLFEPQRTSMLGQRLCDNGRATSVHGRSCESICMASYKVRRAARQGERQLQALLAYTIPVEAVDT